MGFVLSLLYIAIAILSPSYVVPELAPYHVQTWLGIAAIVTSVPAILEFPVLSIPQVRFLGLVIVGIIASFVFNGWLGGIVYALGEFIPNAIVFFFVLLNFRSLGRLRALALVLLSVTVYIVVVGAIAYFRGNPDSPMIYVQPMEDHSWFPRIRALGFLNDPNDLAQYILSFLPLLWLNWQAKRRVRNFALVLVPATVLLTGIFLTHSRGAIIALVIVTVFALKETIGITWSMILAGCVFLVTTVLNFSGGRDVSFQAGSSRVEAWGSGIAMLVSHPLFGVGYNQFYEFNDIAAHNTFIHCAAELGLFGYFFWMALVVFSMSDLGSMASAPLESSTAGIGKTEASSNTADTEENELKIRRWATLVRLGFVGYLVAAVFLSRSYAMTLFLLLGMASALRMIAVKSPVFSFNKPALRLFQTSAILVLVSLFWIYFAVRIRWL